MTHPLSALMLVLGLCLTLIKGAEAPLFSVPTETERPTVVTSGAEETTVLCPEEDASCQTELPTEMVTTEPTAASSEKETTPAPTATTNPSAPSCPQETPDTSTVTTEQKPTATAPKQTTPEMTKKPEASTPVTSVPETTKKPETAAPETAPSETVAPETSLPASAVNDYEREVVDLVNDIRRQYGLSELTLNEELSAVAREKSADMQRNGYFSHTSPTYGSPFDMMKSFGITYRSAGENIAMGYPTPAEVVNGWMNSEGHRANILNASFTEIGVGYVANGHYWTQMFIG